MAKKVFLFCWNLFNFRLGWLAIPIIGGMVTLVNVDHGAEEALRAGAVAGFTGLFVTSAMIRVIQYFAEWQRRDLSYALGSGIPTCVTLIMHLGGQSANHTPRLLWSVVAPTLLTFFSSIVLNACTYYFAHHPGPFGLFGRACKYLFTIPGRCRP